MRLPRAGQSAGLSVIAVGILITTACGGSSSSAYVENGQPLTFATFNPYTGPDASFGPENGSGCFAAIKSIAAAGGVLGHSTATCLAVDSRGDPADAVPAVQKMLATTTNLMEVQGPSSDEASATAPIINAAHIPMFADTGQPIFDKSTFHYFWRIDPSDAYYGYAEALYAYDAGYRRAALVFGNDISSQGTVPTITSAFQKLGGTIAINQTLTIGQSSYRSEASQVIAANPDIIFTETDPQTAATFFGQLKQLHGVYPFISTGAQATQWIQAVTGTIGADSLAQIYHECAGNASFSGPAWNEFNTNMLASSADVQNPAQWTQDVYSAADYDGVIISALAMLAAKTTDPKVWNDYIPKVTTAGGSAQVVYTFADGKAALAAGKTISYSGSSGPVAWDQWHNSEGGFEILGYASANGSQPILKVYPAGAVNKLVS